MLFTKVRVQLLIGDLFSKTRKYCYVEFNFVFKGHDRKEGPKGQLSYLEHQPQLARQKQPPKHEKRR